MYNRECIKRLLLYAHDIALDQTYCKGKHKITSITKYQRC